MGPDQVSTREHPAAMAGVLSPASIAWDSVNAAEPRPTRPIGSRSRLCRDGRFLNGDARDEYVFAGRAVTALPFSTETSGDSNNRMAGDGTPS